MKSKISIIVPCYNQAHYLNDCLQSVLAQTYENWECIIVNDGSPDNTEEVAKNWVEKDARFSYLYKENGGLSSARNAGIDISIGNWIQFLDSDDCLHPEKLEKSIFIVNQFSNIKLVVSKFNMFTKTFHHSNDEKVNFNQKSLTYENILYYWGEKFVIPIHCGFFDAEIVKNIKFEEKFKAIEDWIFWLSFLENTKEAYFLNLTLAYYRNNLNSMTKNNELIQLNLLIAYKYIYQKLNQDYAKDFIFKILDRQNNKIIKQNVQIAKLSLYRNNYLIRGVIKLLKYFKF